MIQKLISNEFKALYACIFNNGNIHYNERTLCACWHKKCYLHKVKFTVNAGGYGLRIVMYDQSIVHTTRAKTCGGIDDLRYERW